jgi:hypothetical protein
MRKRKDNAETPRTQRLAESWAVKTIGCKSSGAMAVVAVEIADFQIAGIVLKDAGLKSQSRDFGGSEGARSVS